MAALRLEHKGRYDGPAPLSGDRTSPTRVLQGYRLCDIHVPAETSCRLSPPARSSRHSAKDRLARAAAPARLQNELPGPELERVEGTLALLNEAPEVAGRPCIAFRRPEWVALEDKILIDLGYLPHRGA
jgi:hypothetical protein